MLKVYNLKEHLWDVKSQNDPSCEVFILQFEANLTKLTVHEFALAYNQIGAGIGLQARNVARTQIHLRGWAKKFDLSINRFFFNVVDLISILKNHESIFFPDLFLQKLYIISDWR